MPVVEIHLLEGYKEPEKTRLCEAVTDAVRLVIPAAPEAITVMLHEHNRSQYMRGRTHRTGAPANPDPSQIVLSYLSAMEARDLDIARKFLAEGFQMTFPGGITFADPADLATWARDRYQSVRKTYDTVEAFQSPGPASIVYTVGTLSGAWPDGTAFEDIRFIDRFEVIAGQLTRQDVWNDIAEVRP